MGAFSSLSERLNHIFSKLTKRGRLTELEIKTAMREVRVALLEADVNIQVAKKFCADVSEKAVGQEILKSLNPAQQVIKIVNDELIALMGSSNQKLAIAPKPPTVIMMCGLQGAGKTTMCGKLAVNLKKSGKKPLLVACDVYRPAAIKQLQINGEKQEVDVFSMGENQSPVDIAKASLEHARKNGHNVVILDTAGRLHIDEAMMTELQEIKKNVEVHKSLLVVDAMTGQDAVNVASEFDEKVGIDGVILSKMDGDTRGGAALSAKAVTGKPIKFVGMGEKLDAMEPFYPDRMASRILGMGDVLTLIDKVQAEYDEEKAKELEKKIRKAEFDFNDFLDQMQQMKKMGGMAEIMKMLPGNMMGGEKLSDDVIGEGEVAMRKMEAIIYSMTKKERANPDLINPPRKKRIAAGAGVDISEVNRVMKQFEQSRKMMKQMSGLMGGKGKRRGFKLPFGL